MLKEPNSLDESDCQERGDKAATLLINSLRSSDSGHFVIGFTRRLVNEHNTIQADTMKALAHAMLAYAKEIMERNRDDLRNEGVIKPILANEALFRTIASAPRV